MADKSTRPIRVIAHRGACEEAPENTLEAVEAAIQPGVDMIECDVHMTKDGHVVVIHDASLDRTTNGSGYVADYTLEEISKLNANYGFIEFKTCKVPTFEEWLRRVLKGKKTPLVEMKAGKGRAPYEGMAEKVYKIVKKHRALHLVVFQSFDFRYLRELRKLDAKVRIHSLYDIPQMRWGVVPNNKEIGSESVNTHHFTATTAFVAAMHQEGFKELVPSIMNELNMERVIQNGVDGIITNKPQLAADVIANPEKYSHKDHTWTIIGASLVVAVVALSWWCISPILRGELQSKGERRHLHPN